MSYYNKNAQKLAEVYLSKTFEQVHHSWQGFLIPILNKDDARILDLGAGAGRDSKFMAESGAGKNVHITAVEPAQMLSEFGKNITKHLNVNWMDDVLPDLVQVTKQEISFDLILLSAVWMHIPHSKRQRSLRKLANLLKPGGKLVISLRHGPSENDRQMFAVCSDELIQQAKEFGLTPLLVTDKVDDVIGRDEISWQTVVLQLPDDGSGAFPFIRHVALNDGKSATHKLALMRVLVRIADGHPGAVIRREDNRVILPAGLVALFWARQYKNLIDRDQIFQSPSKSINMGFMKNDGWNKLTQLQASDYCIGNLFSGQTAFAMHKMLSACVYNIRDMPCKYITFPNTKKGVFEVNSKTVKAKDSLFLDIESLERWGEFSLPEHLWNAFSRYACWIEPVLISEWAKLMAGYAGNSQYNNPKDQYKLVNALHWLEAKRNTNEVRKRFEIVQSNTSNKHRCIWTDKSLKNQYAIDHCLPFSRWPNNDLWNLLPSDVTANGKKSDRLPTDLRIKSAKDRITNWWSDAWIAPQIDKTKNQSKRFFAEANLALPGLTTSNKSIDDLFDALLLQRCRLKEMQQLREW